MCRRVGIKRAKEICISSAPTLILTRTPIPGSPIGQLAAEATPASAPLISKDQQGFEGPLALTLLSMLSPTYLVPKAVCLPTAAIWWQADPAALGFSQVLGMPLR